jgi:hypothetical protein
MAMVEVNEYEGTGGAEEDKTINQGQAPDLAACRV